LENIQHLAPGDIKVGYQNCALLPTDEIMLDKHLEALESEVAYKPERGSSMVGFCRD